MQTVRPTPIRAFKGKRDMSPGLKHSKSSADVSSLSRTSSFLSFTGLENLKSSALFGIFEKGGLDTEPHTPDIQSHYDFHLSDTRQTESPDEKEQVNRALTAAKAVGIASAACIFILLYNRIPSHNKELRYLPSTTQLTNPFIYTLLATLTALLFPLLDLQIAKLMPRKKAISEPVPKQSSENSQQTASTPRNARRSSEWSFNVILRYFAGLLGVAYAGTKLDFSQPSQFNLCVGAITLATLTILDRTLRGLLLSVAMAIFISACYVAFVRIPLTEAGPIALVIWLNVSVYGSLGKVLRLWR